MKRVWVMFVSFCLFFFLVGCSNVEEQQISDSETEISRLKQDLQDKDSQLLELQEQQNNLSLLSDRFLMIKDNSNFLFHAVKQGANQFPILNDEGNSVKEEILKSINFNSNLIDVKDNEIILYAGLADVDSKAVEVIVELTVYQNFQNDEEIGPIKVMFINMAKQDGKWIIKSFSRTN
jgi:hypothetical protein